MSTDSPSNKEVFAKSAAAAGGVVGGLSLGVIIVMVVIGLVICLGCTFCCFSSSLLTALTEDSQTY